MPRGRIGRILVASLTIAVLLLSSNASAQGVNSVPKKEDPIRESDDAFRYRMFGTQNMWTFILLDTTSGQAWQVQYSVDEAPAHMLPINLSSLLPSGATPVNGRFTLYSTDNLYNFLLLDRDDGRVWQLQWSQDADLRGIVQEIE